MSQTKTEADEVKDLVSTTEPTAEPEAEAEAQNVNIRRATLTTPYNGWWIDFDDNFTMGQLDQLATNKYLEIREALLEIIVKWNIKDKAGKDIALTGTLDQFKRVSRNLLMAMAAALFGETTVPEA